MKPIHQTSGSGENVSGMSYRILKGGIGSEKLVSLNNCLFNILFDIINSYFVDKYFEFFTKEHVNLHEKIILSRNAEKIESQLYTHSTGSGGSRISRRGANHVGGEVPTADASFLIFSKIHLGYWMSTWKSNADIKIKN